MNAAGIADTSNAPFYLLDTNIPIHYVRRTKLQQKMEAQYQLLATPTVPALSYVTEAEIKSFARRRNWGEANVQQMNFLLTLFRRLPIEVPNILQAYIEIDTFSGLMGREMGKNDLWIAATAYATGATLLTTDKDFDHLNGFYFPVEWIDPAL